MVMESIKYIASKENFLVRVPAKYNVCIRNKTFDQTFMTKLSIQKYQVEHTIISIFDYRDSH